MDKKQAEKRIGKLRSVINHHRYLYHVLDKQGISDGALDSLKKELFDLEEQYPDLITVDSPTQRVSGKPLDKFAKHKHSERMLSFNDAFSQKDIRDWQARIVKLLSEKEKKELDYFAEAKIDGLAVSLLYQKGVFQRGATRGDGLVGEDVTNNLKTIESIPLKLEKPIDCEVRGEVFINKKDFEKLNQARVKKGEPAYANPRNTAAGAVRQLNPKVAASRKLNFLAWALLGRENQQAEYQELQELGFKPVEGKYCSDLPALFDYYGQLQKKRERFPFQIDGVVVSVNSAALFKKLGVAGKAPRGAIAYKFPMKEATTKVEDIKLQVGRTGAITPVAILKPKEIGGAVISRATLHNEDEIKRLGLKIGDTVIVGRAGDVIPKVFKVLKDLRDGREKAFQMPKTCPVCQSRLEKKQGEVLWRCPDSNCQKRRRGQLYHFVSKAAFNIDGLGPKIIDRLLEEGLISDAADLFELKQGDLVPLERFADKAAQNLVEAINRARKVTLARFIFALGIRGVGEETSIDLAERFSSLEKLSKASVEQLLALPDIGPETVQSITSFFKSSENLDLVKRLLKAGITIKKVTEVRPLSAQKLEDKTFVLTGALESLTRDEVKETIRSLGGNVSSAISKETDFVVVGKEPGVKLDKAKKLGVKILLEQEFLKMLL